MNIGIKKCKPLKNVFFKNKSGELHTPIPDSFLDGITRKSIISLAEELNIKVEIKKIKLQDVLVADELFFTGTAAEVVPIRSVDKKLISNGERGEITTILQKNYFDQVRGKRSSFPEWHTLVD